MSFSRIRPPGSWTPLSVLTSAEEEVFDQNQSRAIDGYAGGAYAPSTSISIGGQGLWLTALNTVHTGGSVAFETGTVLDGFAGSGLIWNGTATFNTGGVNFNSGFIASAECDFSAVLQISATGTLVLVSGALLNAAAGSAASFAGVLNYSGTGGTWSGPLTRQGTTTYAGGGVHEAGTVHSTAQRHIDSGGSIQADSGSSVSCNLGSTVSLLGTVSIGALATASCAAPLVMTGAGRIRVRAILGVDANHTYGANDADVIYTTTTAPRTYTITSTGAANGDQIRIAGALGSGSLTLVDDSSSVIAVMQTVTGYPVRLTLTFIASAWRITATSPYT